MAGETPRIKELGRRQGQQIQGPGEGEGDQGETEENRRRRVGKMWYYLQLQYINCSLDDFMLSPLQGKPCLRYGGEDSISPSTQSFVATKG